MKKILSLILIVLSLTLIIQTLVTANQSMNIFVNEHQVSFYPPPRLVEGTTLVPVRAYFEGFGALVHFDAKSEEITVFRGNQKLILKKNDGVIYHNGSAYAPVRLISQSLGDEIIYINTDRSIRIKSEFGWTQKYLAPPEKPELVSGQIGIVAITFDDGPGIYTNRIIDTLKKHDSGATFFVLGCNIHGNEGIIKRIADEGFEIGNHTYNHPNMLKISENEIKSQINRTQVLINNITGSRPFLYRPPYGSYSKTLANSIDMAMVLWSVDPANWLVKSSDAIVSNIMTNVRDGSIILMHDSSYITSITLDRILTGLKNKGYRVVSVTDMLRVHNIEPKKHMIYFCSYDIR